MNNLIVNNSKTNIKRTFRITYETEVLVGAIDEERAEARAHNQLINNPELYNNRYRHCTKIEELYVQ